MNEKDRVKAKLKGDSCFMCENAMINSFVRLTRQHSVYCKKHKHGKHKEDWCRFFAKGKVYSDADEE